MPALKRKLVNAPIIGVDGADSAKPVPVGTRIEVLPERFFTDEIGMVIGTEHSGAVFGHWTGEEWKWVEKLTASRYSQSNVYLVPSNYAPYKITYHFPSGASVGPYTYMIKESDSSVYDLRFALPEEFSVRTDPVLPSQLDLLSGRIDVLLGQFDAHTLAANAHAVTPDRIGAVALSRVGTPRNSSGYGVAPLDYEGHLPPQFFGQPANYGAVGLNLRNVPNGFVGLNALAKMELAQLPAQGYTGNVTVGTKTFSFQNGLLTMVSG